MKNIEVSDEIYDKLIELSKELNSQNHRGTAMPYFFQIQTKKEVAVPEGCGNECWYCDGSKIETDEEIKETIFNWKDWERGNPDVENTFMSLEDWEKEEILEESGWQKGYYDYVNQYENSFFTEKACKEHIQANAYHYHSPVDYLSHAFRNPELELVLNFICGLTGEIHK